MARFLSLQLPLGRLELRLERLGVDPEQHVAFLHQLAFAVVDPVEVAGDARDDVDLPRALGLRDERGDVRNALRLHRHDRDLRRGPLGRRWSVLGAGGDERAGEKYAGCAAQRRHGGTLSAT